MSQFNAPVRRSGGDLDVYTGLLLVATLVLAAGAFLLAKNNMDHSADPTQRADGGMFKLVEQQSRR